MAILSQSVQNTQRTLKRTVSFSGVGLHSGKNINVEIRPAHANTGILFERSDLPGSGYLKAHPDSVFDTTLATRIGSKEVNISTIEHLMSALFGFGIDNAVVSVSAAEMPVLDGSAVPFLVMLDEAGIQDLQAARKVLVVKKPIEIVDPKDPTRFIRIEPSSKPWISYSIEFANAGAIGKQNVSFEFSGTAFCRELAFARTFCLAEDIARMQSVGLARGGSLENAVVVCRNNGVLNAAGLRSETEFVRHKALDCIGDLALVGMPILGHVIANKAGHDLHTNLAKALIHDTGAVQVLEPKAQEAIQLAPLFDFPRSLAQLRLAFAGLPTG